jgi:hypothetical protein
MVEVLFAITIVLIKFMEITCRELQFEHLESKDKMSLLLNLNRTSLSSISQRAFDGFTNLEKLDHEGNLFTFINGSFFNQSGLKNLTQLSLKSNKIDKIDEAAFEWLNKLERLDLSENLLKVIEANAFKS